MVFKKDLKTRYILQKQKKSYKITKGLKRYKKCIKN